MAPESGFAGFVGRGGFFEPRAQPSHLLGFVGRRNVFEGNLLGFVDRCSVSESPEVAAENRFAGFVADLSTGAVFSKAKWAQLRRERPELVTEATSIYIYICIYKL